MKLTIQYIQKELAPYYPDTEIQGLVRIILENVLGISYTQIIVDREKVVSERDRKKIEEIVERLNDQEPIQYILGETEFYDLKFKVNSSVLIPRQETEELVHWILQAPLRSKAKILDIGTGSGCIPIALKKNLPDADIKAVDISVDALEMAGKNAVLNGIDIKFELTNFLDWKKYTWDTYDVVVSNPPYVRELEKEQMENNVLLHEPENALFVSNEDPLVFYRCIAEFARDYLTTGGYLFFEINEFLGIEMTELVKGLGFREIALRKDLNGKDRMLMCKK